MNIYKFSCVTYDSDCYYYLLHEKVFSEEEFEKMIFEATLKALEKEVDEILDLEKEDDDSDFEMHYTFGWLDGEICEILMKDFGFEKISPICDWEIDEFADILILEGDKEKCKKEEEIRLREYIDKNMSSGLREKLKKLKVSNYNY